jgi:hypothetical protein
MSEMPEAVVRWHAIVDATDPDERARLLDAILADDCVFRSPAIHKPQEGKALTTTYLSAAMVVLGPTLHYDRELYSDDSAVLEFHCELDGREVHGIDFLRWGADDRLVEFTVMVRPVSALQVLMGKMVEQLPA